MKIRTASIIIAALSLGALAIALVTGPTTSLASPEVGKKAPTFTGTDSNGKKHDLAKYRGKYVVLEWLNHGCPYVKKHYNSENMQALQKRWTKKGVVWLSVISSAKGKQGNMAPKEINGVTKKKGAHPTAILLDEGGKIGKLYGAQTTPHMFVIDPKGMLIYQGAIDDKPTTDPDTVEGAENYVSAALTAAMAGKPVEPSSTKSYGCGVKY